MKSIPEILSAYEFDALLDAIRRDMRIQLALSRSSPDWADWHKANARQDQRLLEALNPKKASKDIQERIPLTEYVAKVMA